MSTNKRNIDNLLYSRNLANAYIAASVVIISLLLVYIAYGDRICRPISEQSISRSCESNSTKTDVAGMTLDKKRSVPDSGFYSYQNENIAEENSKQQPADFVNDISRLNEFKNRIDKFILLQDKESLDAVHESIDDIHELSREEKLALLESLRKRISEGLNEEVSRAMADLLVLDAYALSSEDGIKPSSWFNEVMRINNDYLQYNIVNMVLNEAEKDSYEWEYSLNYLKDKIHSMSNEMKAGAEALLTMHDPTIDKDKRAREVLYDSDSIQAKMVYMEMLDMENEENRQVVADIFNDTEQPLDFRLRAMNLYQMGINMTEMNEAQ